MNQKSDTEIVYCDHEVMTSASSSFLPQSVPASIESRVIQPHNRMILVYVCGTQPSPSMIVSN